MTRAPARSAIGRLLVLVAALAAGCSREPSVGSAETGPAPARARAPGATTIRYTDPVNVDVRDVPVLMALDELRSRGYTIEHNQVAGPPLIADMLARGETELGVLNNQTMWSAIAKGADVRTIVQFAAPTTVLAANRSIASCRELDGKPMGVSGPTGLSQILIQLYLQRRCGGARPQLMVMAESSGRASALLAGRLEAAVMPGEELMKLQLQAPGRLRALMTHAEEFPDLHIDGIHAGRDWAARHPESVRDFLRALIGAQRRIADDPPLLYAEARRRLALDETTIKAVADFHLRMGIWDPDGALTPAVVQSTIDFLVETGGLPPGLNAAQAADLSYLNDVLAEMGRRRIAPEPPPSRTDR